MYVVSRCRAYGGLRPNMQCIVTGARMGYGRLSVYRAPNLPSNTGQTGQQAYVCCTYTCYVSRIVMAQGLRRSYQQLARLRGVLYRPGDTARQQQKKKSLVSLGDAATRLYTPGDVAFLSIFFCLELLRKERGSPIAPQIILRDN